MRISPRFLTRSALIAAIYAALTLLLAPISFGAAGQIRVAEALCILPCLTPAAIPGLTVGCCLANLIGGFGIWDMVIGSAATLLAALWTRKIKRPWLSPLPAVVLNVVMVGPMLWLITGLPLWSCCMYLFIGQAVACFGLGLPLLRILSRYGTALFKD